jgi:Carboxypeptidase regulatory-like domain
MTTLTPVLLAAILFFPSSLMAQEPPPPPPAATPSAPQSTPGTGSSSSKTKNRAIPSFLIIGTVFNENSLSFPGVQVRVRRNGEKKAIQQTSTNSRGEFAIRVPPGYEYEVVTHVKKYDDKIENVDSKVDVQQRLSIKLEPKGQAKAGAKQ